jgi:hypothetical protein
LHVATNAAYSGSCGACTDGPDGLRGPDGGKRGAALWAARSAEPIRDSAAGKMARLNAEFGW